MRFTRSLQSRLLLGAGAWSALALVATGVLLAYLMREQLETQVRTKLATDMTQLLGHTEIGEDGMPFTTLELSDPLYQKIYSGSYWQFSQDDRVLLRSRSLWDQELPGAVSDGKTRAQYLHVMGPQDNRLMSLHREITLPRSPGIWRIQVTRDISDIETAMRQFNLVLGVGLGTLALALLLASILQVRVGLRPLARMRKGLGRVRQGRSVSLAGEYPMEVQPLVNDLNGVLLDNAALIERARSRAGNLAHALKTPLSVLANEADGIMGTHDQALGKRLRVEVDTMRRQLDWHLAHARLAAVRRPGVNTSVDHVIGRLARTLSKLYPDKEILFNPDTRRHFGGESQDLEQMLGNLMDNACKWAQTVVNISAERSGNDLVLRVEDDGPGLTDEKKSRALLRGKRLDENAPGDGLGLSIVKELAELYGGSLSLEDAEAGGLLAVLRLPLAMRD